MICNIQKCSQKEEGVPQMMPGILAVSLEWWRACAPTPWVLLTIQWGYRSYFRELGFFCSSFCELWYF